jgi:excisionase family DNA binding protein
MSKPFLSVQQVAERLGVTPRSVLRFAEAKKLPKPLVIGSRMKWLPGQIDEFLNNGGSVEQVEKAGGK